MSDSESRKDDLMARMRHLPAVELEPARARRVLARAGAAFQQSHRPSGPLQRLYFRAEPLLAGAVSALYLAWALQTAFALLR